MPRMRCTRSCKASVPSKAFYALGTIALPFLKADTAVAKMDCTLGVSEQTCSLRPRKFTGIAAVESLRGRQIATAPHARLPAHVSPDRTPAERAPCPPCHQLSSIHSPLPALARDQATLRTTARRCGMTQVVIISSLSDAQKRTMQSPSSLLAGPTLHATRHYYSFFRLPYSIST
jgi:hypothetical protein